MTDTTGEENTNVMTVMNVTGMMIMTGAADIIGGEDNQGNLTKINFVILNCLVEFRFYI